MGGKCLIDTDELARTLEQDSLKIVDCRFSLADTDWGRSEYMNGHIPGAIYAHLDNDLSAPVQAGITGRHPLPDPRIFMQKLENWGMRNSDTVVVYDQSHGGLAARLWWMLHWVGHEKVLVLNGGWAGWNQSGMRVSSDLPMHKASRFDGQADAEMLIDLQEMTGWSNDSSRTIVDARASTRYTGENEPIDPVAGHIPGACNMPFLDNLNDGGKWKSPEELRTRFAEIISGSPERMVVYCGSGVTACHDILALEVAGFPGVRLYPGSWSEWIASGENPVSCVTTET